MGRGDQRRSGSKQFTSSEMRHRRTPVFSALKPTEGRPISLFQGHPGGGKGVGGLWHSESPRTRLCQLLA